MNCFFCERACDEPQLHPDLPPSHFYCRIAAVMKAAGFDAFTVPPES